MSALDAMSRCELNCGEQESFGVGNGVELTILEINGDDVVLRITGVEESHVVIVGEPTIEKATFLGKGLRQPADFDGTEESSLSNQ